jgi:hypothetical protein
MAGERNRPLAQFLGKNVMVMMMMMMMMMMIKKKVNNYA